MLKSHGALMKSYGIVLESNPLTTQPIFDHPQAIHDPNTGFIHPLIHTYPWKSTKKYISFQHQQVFFYDC